MILDEQIGERQLHISKVGTQLRKISPILRWAEREGFTLLEREDGLLDILDDFGKYVSEGVDYSDIDLSEFEEEVVR